MTGTAQIVSPFKDVEGLHFKFHYNLYHKYETFFLLDKDLMQKAM
jgi:hypothetical protein